MDAIDASMRKQRTKLSKERKKELTEDPRGPLRKKELTEDPR